ncbi:tail fiber domain-containing protein [Sphaerisporangium corydalis]|uniref:Tail fiber domain-containing protein n=1 Tax=Sphaerisporangium corydalis TaxID=1441875 RepID=A0ABV9E600_9ACTN|nr:tail fiber domain-containing protein [Sphaerisporangium corydalis]
MSKYDQPDVVQRRVRFFDGQFLRDVDFIDEQHYHLDRVHGIAKALRTTGVHHGLEVTATGQNLVVVAAGGAFDRLGRQIVLPSPVEVHLPERFRGKSGIGIAIAYLASEAAMATSEGSKENTRWDETPALGVFLSGEEPFAIRADQAETRWDLVGASSVTLAHLAVSAGGEVTVDTGFAERTGLRVPGVLGVGVAEPLARLHVAGGARYSIDLRVDGRLHSASDDGGLWVGTQPKGFIGGVEGGDIGFWNNDAWRLRVGKNGNVSIGSGTPDATTRLTVTAGDRHLVLRREPTATTGGRQIFLELYQEDAAGPKVPEVAPSIRFHHANRFWHRLEARSDGLHVKDGNTGSENYSNLSVQALSATTDITSGQNVSAAKDVSAGQNVTAKKDISAENITARRDITADNVTAKKDITAENITAKRDITASQNITTDQNITAKKDISATQNITADQNITAKKDLTAGQNITVTRDGKIGGVLTVAGKSGVGTTDPKAKLHVAGSDRYSVDLRVDGRLHSASDDGGLWVGTDLKGFVGGLEGGDIGFWSNDAWRLRVSRAGNVSIGTNAPDPGNKLTVSAGERHLVLRREPTATTGGKQLFLELFQEESGSPKIPEIAPSIRFHHANRFWHRLEARGDGLHIKAGDLNIDTYSNLTVGTLFTTDIRASHDIYADGQIYFHPGYEWGFEGPDHSRRYWYIFRPRWNINNFSDGGAVLRASGISYPSDARLKDDATTVPDALRAIEGLRGVRFTWNDEGLRHLVGDVESSVTAGPEASDEDNREVWDSVRAARLAEVDRPEIGVLAQDVERVLPELVHTDKAGYKSVDYGKLTAVLIEAIKEQQSQIRTLDTRLTTLTTGPDTGDAL